MGTWSPQPVPEDSSPHRVKSEPEHPPGPESAPGQLAPQQIPEEAPLSWEWVRGWAEVEGLKEKGGIREKGSSEGRVGK